ncbi:hypothetical protein AALO_G00241070 [Alosa alosa]|uniref:MAC-inhibitory protein n=1 Tax=Alosa alosa TaxID=278164 RepID=A0AAV6FS87_9TELE|nr:CD59 glycoprotein-like [Alosa sapidissima]XP_048126673.1 CD59 glycoprotein-like [Alosa alosa]KAG5265329.1 hypothetical protein AALO_G00241070 [Alosa alosa]
MKAFLVALLLMMTVANGCALKCRRCVPSVPGGRCTVSTETCSSNMDACVAARFLISPFSYFNRCIKMSDCRILQRSPYIKANCCQTDMCNISSF